MTKLARLIANEEGFFTSGTLPQRNNNPGDLRHSPHSQHDSEHPEAIGRIDTVAHGWEDLERQLRLYAGRMVSVDPETGKSVPAHWMTLRDAIYMWAPPSENNSAKYLADVVAGFDGAVTPYTQLSEVLAIEDEAAARPKVVT